MAFIILVPIFLGVAAGIHPDINRAISQLYPTNAVRLCIAYSSFLLCFFAGALWCFAIQKQDTNTLTYMSGIIPLVFVFKPLALTSDLRIIILILGYLIILAFDIRFHLRTLVPSWWLRFKTLLTAAVVLCLIFFQFRNLLSATFGLND